MNAFSPHYARLQGVDESWRVDAVDLRLNERRVENRLSHVGSGVGCPDHGVKSIVPPWAGKQSRFTLFFEAFAIEVLQACRTVEAAASLLGLPWDAAQTIMDRALERGFERRETTPIPHVGID